MLLSHDALQKTLPTLPHKTTEPKGDTIEDPICGAWLHPSLQRVQRLLNPIRFHSLCNIYYAIDLFALFVLLMLFAFLMPIIRYLGAVFFFRTITT